MTLTNKISSKQFLKFMCHAISIECLFVIHKEDELRQLNGLIKCVLSTLNTTHHHPHQRSPTHPPLNSHVSYTTFPFSPPKDTHRSLSW